VADQKVELFRDMAEQIISGGGASAATHLASDASPSLRLAVLKHAESVAKYSTSADLKDAAQKIIGILRPPTNGGKATGGGDNTKLYLLGAAGLAAGWFFFIRK
jgi:LPXTG-motif cell wall-anchored protein